MATVLLSAAGSAIGGAIGGSVLGVGAATLGNAVGAVAGSLIDQRILGQGSRAVEVGRARALRIQGSTEGAPIPVIFGRMRVAGQIIWSTRYLERVRTTTAGGKATGGQRVREFSYSISFAVGLVEGPIDRIGRIWADGQPMDPARFEMRIHRGSADQLPDPKIEAVEGAENAPAYRDLAYVVFEDFPVGEFGNRIPQLSFEVFRSNPMAAAAAGSAEASAPLSALIRGVAMAPGTGEFSLDPEPARYLLPNGTARFANVNNAEGRADLAVALDQLEAELPDCEAVSLVVSWFGTDLRAARCRVEPRVEERGRRSAPREWWVAGLTTGTAPLVSRDEQGRPNFGGAPSDAAVVRGIREMTARGKRVMLYPFLLMDVPPGNALPDPYGAAEQSSFPWRGRITLERAPGIEGSTDQTPAAAAEVAAFFGTARAADFAVAGDGVAYSGPDEWGWRRFVLHLATLAKAAGGVDAICIGSELRGLTQIRASRTDYPAVEQLRALAAEVRLILPGARISYAADWSEYSGHRPGDGSSDVIFHLDPLWADANIDFVGIDDYTSLSDWRHEAGHRDAALSPSIYSLGYLKGNVEGGENYDWFYASDEDRAAQIRSPIVDGAHGEDWVFRAKDIRGWWLNPHHNRIGGVREATPTAWVPQSKPVWLTETGCPAVDLGANAPNLFLDGRSSESALPFGSRGVRDDEMQRRFLQAKLGYWAEAGSNPVSAVYGGPMIPADGVFVWTWDARPWPDFPVRESIWADGPAHRVGHWLSGRVLSGGLADVVAEICAAGGIAQADVAGLFGVVHGFVIERPSSVREALQPLMTVYGFDAFESGGVLRFRMRSGRMDHPLDAEALVEGAEAGRALEVVRASGGEEPDIVRFFHYEAESDYRHAVAETRRPGAGDAAVAETSLAISLPGATAQATAERWLAEGEGTRVRASFRLPPSALAVEPGDVVTIGGEGGGRAWRIERLTRGATLEVEAGRIDPGLYLPGRAAGNAAEPPLVRPPGPVEAVFLNLPLADGSARDHRPFLAVAAEPWAGDMAVHVSRDGESHELIGRITRPARLGLTLEPLPPGRPGRWQRASVAVALPDDALSSEPPERVLNGANLMALEAAPGQWELIQARDAVLEAPGRYRLGGFLRGQRGTEALSGAEVPAGRRIVLIDEALFELPLAVDEVGVVRSYRVGPARLGFSHPAFVAIEGVAEGIGLRPYAPARLRARQGPGGLAVRWTRRTRVGGDAWGLAEVPLGEEAERYRLRISQGGALLREVTLAAPEFDYTTGMQVADGRVSAIEIAVAQISPVFGPGPERVITSDD